MNEGGSKDSLLHCILNTRPKFPKPVCLQRQVENAVNSRSADDSDVVSQTVAEIPEILGAPVQTGGEPPAPNASKRLKTMQSKAFYSVSPVRLARVEERVLRGMLVLDGVVE